MAVVLILNPRNDKRFGMRVRELFAAGTASAARVQSALREQYPLAVVRPRVLSGMSDDGWYVYRDGRWIAD
jgi:hypothetical protein